MDAAIRTWGLTKRYGHTYALHGVDLEVRENLVFGYLGPNGSGKTTTIRILAGLMRPTSGRAEVRGHDVVRERERTQRLIGYLPGDFVAYPELTGAQFLRYLSALRGDVDWSRVEHLSKRLGLDLDRRIGALSHGNRQKVGIVQAFMHDPEVLLLDEPTSGLDPLVQREFLDLVRETRESGRTVFLSSHVLSEVEAVADVVAILRSGRVVVTDTVDRLKEQAVRRLDLVFAGDPPVEEIRRADGVRDLQVTGSTAHVALEGSDGRPAVGDRTLRCRERGHARAGPRGGLPRLVRAREVTPMLTSVFAKSLRDQRWALFGWGTGIVLIVVIISAVWPTMRGMPNLDEFLAGYPEPLRELFAMDAILTASGFMNAELFTLMLPILFIIFGISRGARMVAGEEESGTMEFLLLTPVSPTRLVLHKAAALAVSTAALGLVVIVSMWLSAAAFDIDLSLADIATGALAVVLLGIEFGFLAVAVGAWTGRRALALGIAGAAAVASYLLYALGLIVEAVEPWRPLSPFQQVLANGPLGGDPPVSMAWAALVAVAFLLAALPVFERRDVHVH